MDATAYIASPKDAFLHAAIRRLWHRLRERPVSESGRLRQGDGGHEGGDHRRRALKLATLLVKTLVPYRKQSIRTRRTPNIACPSDHAFDRLLHQ